MGLLRVLRLPTMALVAISCVAGTGCTPSTGGSGNDSQPASPDARSSPTPSPSGPPAVARSSTLLCADHIATPKTPASDLQVIQGAVALPTAASAGPLQASSSGDRGSWLFAKRGLLVRTGRSFDLVVPHKERHRLALAWGKPGKPTWRLHVSCPHPYAKWLAFPGGYLVPSRRCASLIIRAADHQDRVDIGVGARCTRN